jgi:UrcA family protein
VCCGARLELTEDAETTAVPDICRPAGRLCNLLVNGDQTAGKSKIASSTIQEMIMTTSTRSTGFRSLIASAFLGALALSFGALSAPEAGPATVTVKYEDLNVASRSGALVLYERIRKAAQVACSYYWFKTDADEARCLHNTIANAVAKVNQPALTAIYNAKFKTPAPSVLVSQSR